MFSKLSTSWKTLKLPDLIDRLYKIVKLRFKELTAEEHYTAMAIMNWHHGPQGSKSSIYRGVRRLKRKKKPCIKNL